MGGTVVQHFPLSLFHRMKYLELPAFFLDAFMIMQVASKIRLTVSRMNAFCNPES